MTDSNHNTNQDSSGYEKSDANLKFIFGVSIVGIVIIVAIVVFLSEYFLYTKETLIYETVLSPESSKLREVRAHEDEILNSYGVINADKGIFRVPIDRAMEIEANEAFSKGK
ncbi:MAG: hypothetical protein KKG33_04350 [candidate division Zixibacteria bacterium]|nr:hypothetical protein [candidate division Zixibacteria bacterium]MBU1470316.1 hypothetical protein [candidate division Zixibacteria bacterium]MBU2624775.1 hypothetical protein [candidate division Zixibacteria bacterium]